MFTYVNDNGVVVTVIVVPQEQPIEISAEPIMIAGQKQED